MSPIVFAPWNRLPIGADAPKTVARLSDESISAVQKESIDRISIGNLEELRKQILSRKRPGQASEYSAVLFRINCPVCAHVTPFRMFAGQRLRKIVDRIVGQNSKAGPLHGFCTIPKKVTSEIRM
jgi:hypothetical protein